MSRQVDARRRLIHWRLPLISAYYFRIIVTLLPSFFLLIEFPSLIVDFSSRFDWSNHVLLNKSHAFVRLLQTRSILHRQAYLEFVRLVPQQTRSVILIWLTGGKLIYVRPYRSMSLNSGHTAWREFGCRRKLWFIYFTHRDKWRHYDITLISKYIHTRKHICLFRC